MKQSVVLYEKQQRFVLKNSNGVVKVALSTKVKKQRIVLKGGGNNN